MATPDGFAQVKARTIQAAGVTKEAVDVAGRFLITPSHRIHYDGQWMKPLQAAGIKPINTAVALYNLIMEPIGAPVLVEDVVVSTLGTFCEGSHKRHKPSHQLWNSPKIVALFKRHSTWPHVSFHSDDMILSSLKDSSNATCYLSLFTGDTLSPPWNELSLHEIVCRVEST